MARDDLFGDVSKLDDDAVYEKAIASRDQLDHKLTEMSAARDRKRQLEAAFSDFENDVAVTERGSNPEMSATAMEKHLKMTLHSMPEWRNLRDEIADVTADIEDLMLDKSVLTRDIEIACARMNVLAGKYVFLGSMQIAESVAS